MITNQFAIMILRWFENSFSLTSILFLEVLHNVVSCKKVVARIKIIIPNTKSHQPSPNIIPITNRGSDGRLIDTAQITAEGFVSPCSS
jgi:hypothetical protein